MLANYSSLFTIQLASENMLQHSNFVCPSWRNLQCHPAGLVFADRNRIPSDVESQNTVCTSRRFFRDFWRVMLRKSDDAQMERRRHRTRDDWLRYSVRQSKDVDSARCIQRHGWANTGVRRWLVTTDSLAPTLPDKLQPCSARRPFSAVPYHSHWLWIVGTLPVDHHLPTTPSPPSSMTSFSY